MRSVLIVEDTEVIARYVATLVQVDAQATVVTSDFARLTDPQDQLWQGVDILVCDIGLPGISGLRILEVAREFHPQIKRVALTAYPEWTAEFTAAREIAHTAVSKMTDLGTVIRAVLE